jgi:hypothetical protein
VFGQTAGREIYDVPIQTDLSNVVSFLELKFAWNSNLGSLIGWVLAPLGRVKIRVPCLRVLTDFKLIYFAEKTIKSTS